MKYQVYLYPKSHQGYGRRRDPRTGKTRWYVSYETRRTDNSDPRREVEWLDVDTAEEAKAERDRRYTELLLHGAKRKGEEPKKLPGKPAPKKEMHPDQYLCKQYIKKVYWTVKVGRKYLGGSESKIEARKIRDRHFRNQEELKPCAHCGKRPVWRGSGSAKRGNTLDHDEPDCPSYAIIKHRDISKMRKAEVWNRHLRKGKFPIKGLIHKSQIEHLL